MVFTHLSRRWLQSFKHEKLLVMSSGILVLLLMVVQPALAEPPSPQVRINPSDCPVSSGLRIEVSEYETGQKHFERCMSGEIAEGPYAAWHANGNNKASGKYRNGK